MEAPRMDPWLEQFEARIAEREQTDRSFTILGVTLTVKPAVAPQVATTYFDAKARLLAYYVARDEARQTDAPIPDLPDDLTDTAIIDRFEQTARACLDAKSIPAWQELRAADRPNPLDWNDLFGLCEYLIARASNHPTDGPSGSSDGPPANGTSSKAASRSRVAASKT